MKGEGGPLSLPPGLLALLLGLPSSSLALSSVLGGPEPQFPLPGTGEKPNFLMTSFFGSGFITNMLPLFLL